MCPDGNNARKVIWIGIGVEENILTFFFISVKKQVKYYL